MPETPRRYRFKYADGDSLRRALEELDLRLPWSDDLAPLLVPTDIGGKRIPNRLAVHPMEGFDANADGSPGALALRRYKRYASGGAGLIWFEATAVTSDGRSNPYQLYLHDGSVAAFERLVESTRSAAWDVFGREHNPFLVLQLTHSGRWSRPGGARRPVVAHHNPTADEFVGIESDYPVVSDDQLTILQEDFVRAASLAAEVGFDAVDIKACHGYLVSELLAAFTREGRFGGSFQNRTRLLRETVVRVRNALPLHLVATRLNAFDGLPYPYGFGVSRDDHNLPDLEEPALLLCALHDAGLALANISVGVPYRTPHLGRPFDRPVRGAAPSPEHPLVGVSRLLDITSRLQGAVGTLPLVGTGYSCARQYFPHVAAGAVSSGDVAIAGVGRMAFAYPDFARDLLEHGALDPNKCCLACSGCTELMRTGGPTGCIVRDRECYKLQRPGRA